MVTLIIEVELFHHGEFICEKEMMSIFRVYLPEIKLDGKNHSI